MRKDYTALTLAEFCTLVAERNTLTYNGKTDADKYELQHVNNWHWADADAADTWQDMRPSRRDYADDADGAEEDSAESSDSAEDDGSETESGEEQP